MARFFLSDYRGSFARSVTIATNSTMLSFDIILLITVHAINSATRQLSCSALNTESSSPYRHTP